MTIHNPYRALIWDMGGVLVRNMDPSIRGRLGAPYGLTSMDVENLFFGNEVALKASIGQATEADAWVYVQHKLNIPAEKMPNFIQVFFSCDQFDEDLYTFTMRLKPRMRIGLLSNAYPETRASLARRFPHFYDMFDATVFSAEERMAKPDPQIYRLTLERLGVEAERAVFVDDFIENVEGARAVGMHAIHFRNSQQVRDELKGAFRIDTADPVFRAGIVADTHVPDRASQMHPGLVPALRTAKVNCILHAGDVCVPSVLETLAKVAPVEMARGNRDWSFIGKGGWVNRLELAGVSVALMHGHGSWINYIVDKFRYMSQGYRIERYKPLLKRAGKGAKVIVFGHTHHAEIIWDDGQLLFNPGSAGCGIYQGRHPSWGILDIFSDGKVTAKILPLEGYLLVKGHWIPRV